MSSCTSPVNTRPVTYRVEVEGGNCVIVAPLSRRNSMRQIGDDIQCPLTQPLDQVLLRVHTRSPPQQTNPDHPEWPPLAGPAASGLQTYPSEVETATTFLPHRSKSLDCTAPMCTPLPSRNAGAVELLRPVSSCSPSKNIATASIPSMACVVNAGAKGANTTCAQSGSFSPCPNAKGLEDAESVPGASLEAFSTGRRASIEEEVPQLKDAYHSLRSEDKASQIPGCVTGMGGVANACPHRHSNELDVTCASTPCATTLPPFIRQPPPERSSPIFQEASPLSELCPNALEDSCPKCMTQKRRIDRTPRQRSSPRWRLLSGPAHLGPLIIVQRRGKVQLGCKRSASILHEEGNRTAQESVSDDTRCSTEHFALTCRITDAVPTSSAFPETLPVADGDNWVLTLPTEMESYRNEVHNLHTKVDAAECELQVMQRRLSSEAETLAHRLIEDRRVEERQRRLQFQATLDALREENRELAAKLETAQQPSRTRAGVIAAETESVRRLQDTETYWRDRLAHAERRLGNELEVAVKAKRDSEGKVLQLTRTLVELRETAGLLMQEKERLKEENAKLLHERQEVDGPGQEEIVYLRRALLEGRQLAEALAVQVGTHRDDLVLQRSRFEEKLSQLQKELSNERRRNADLVSLYGNQVESLHSQLLDAQSQKKRLAAKVAEHTRESCDDITH